MSLVIAIRDNLCKDCMFNIEGICIIENYNVEKDPAYACSSYNKKSNEIHQYENINDES